ncbi:hypothetical protein KP509_24G013600 [Ceratopteris richardii]|uniref:Uncharacterized protein n=1 Tax=Ceratopteris richardii TaxID=49495 RepID=A0A8T2RUP9_CERRI|nr:hypothetical protein KP509_24G013600 [Ceratopteris richardii]
MNLCCCSPHVISTVKDHPLTTFRYSCRPSRYNVVLESGRRGCSYMAVQDHLIDIIVIGCTNLRDIKIISKQNPYVVLEYGDSNYRTMIDRLCARHPIFNDTAGRWSSGT